MLLSTCALLILSVEQKQARASIHYLQECFAQASNGADVDTAELASRAEHLIRFAESHHQRRLENALFPALRAASGEAAAALRKLECLGQAGLDLLPRMRSALRAGGDAGGQQRAGELVQAYCHNLLARLACEEDELLPIAERVLPGEAWFRVGTQFLRQDAQRVRPLHEPVSPYTTAC